METSRPPSPMEPASRNFAPRFEPERFYRHAPYPYRQEYAPVLRYHRDPDTALAELALFHFWITRCAYRQSAGEAALPDAPFPAGWPPPERAEHVAVEEVLGNPLELLLESRSDLYQRFFLLGRHVQDPLGLKTVALALACQLFEDPSPAVRRWLETKVERLFAEIVRSCAGGCDPARFRHA